MPPGPPAMGETGSSNPGAPPRANERAACRRYGSVATGLAAHRLADPSVGWGGGGGAAGRCRLSPGCLPPPHRTVRAVLPHTAHRHRSPAGIRKRGSHRPVQAIDAELVRPLVIEAGDPVAALESVLGAGEEREAFVDVAVDLGELPAGVAVAEVIAPTTQHAVEILDRPLQRQPRVAAIRAVANLASDGGHRPLGRPLVQIPTARLLPRLSHPMLK